MSCWLFADNGRLNTCGNIVEWTSELFRIQLVGFLIAMHRMRTILTAALLIVSTPVVGQEPIAKFFRAINLNGPAMVIDGQLWEAGDAQNLQFEAMAFENQDVPLKPTTDSNRAKMIRSSRWGQKFSVELLEVPTGAYQFFAYVWEDNDPEQYAIQLNGKTVVTQFSSGTREIGRASCRERVWSDV